MHKVSRKKKKIPLARATIPRFYRIDFIPPLFIPSYIFSNKAGYIRRAGMFIACRFVKRFSRTPVGYCARNHRRETMRECTSPMRGKIHARGSGRTLWNGMRGRRVGAWAAAGRTHV